jgi:hypothetical protein
LNWVIVHEITKELFKTARLARFDLMAWDGLEALELIGTW